MRELSDWLASRIQILSTGCWLWIAGGDGQGYGSTGHERAHRFVYKLLVGPIPEGKYLLHNNSCSRRCVNPEHLRIGDHNENMADKRKLTLEDEEAVKALISSGMSQRAIAKELGVSQWMIYSIVNGRPKRVRK